MSASLTLNTTTTASATGTAGDLYENTGNNPVIIRYAANVSTHISIRGDATTSDAYIFAGIPELLNIDPGKTLSVIKATGEDDGNAWATVATRA